MRMLSPFRVLGLTEEKGLLCGKLLGMLGADVIKVERPGGDPARNIGPFYHDEADPERSLFWFALNGSKRGVTLDVERPQGRSIFLRLLATADIVVESLPLGYLDSVGLCFSVLGQARPGIILVSISAFGQAGPWKDLKTSDLGSWSLGGYLYPFGDTDRPPVRIGDVPQSYFRAGAASMCCCCGEWTVPSATVEEICAGG